MVKISAIPSVNAYNIRPLVFKGCRNQPSPQNRQDEKALENSQECLASMRRADTNPSHTFNDKQISGTQIVTRNGIVLHKDTGKAMNGIVIKSDKKGAKIFEQYSDGLLTKRTKLKPGAKDTKDVTSIDYVDEYTYLQNPPTKTYNTYKFNDLVGDLALWEKTTVTPDVIAVYHIGRIETDKTKLTVLDKKTRKKISETTFSPARLDKNHKFAPQYENEMAFLTKRLMPLERFEFFEDGKTVKKKTIFHREFTRTEISYDKKGKISSKFIYDKFNRPYNITFFGMSNDYIRLNKHSPAKYDGSAPYKMNIKFLTNRTSDSLESYERYQPREIISTGKIENVTLELGDTTYILQNLFWDRNTNNMVTVQTPNARSKFKIDPSLTAFKTFNDIAKKNEGAYANPHFDLSEFMEKFAQEIETRSSFSVIGRYTMVNTTYVPNTQGTGLLFFPNTRDGVDNDARLKINELYLKINECCKKYNEEYQNPA